MTQMLHIVLLAGTVLGYHGEYAAASQASPEKKETASRSTDASALYNYEAIEKRFNSISTPINNATGAPFAGTYPWTQVKSAFLGNSRSYPCREGVKCMAMGPAPTNTAKPEFQLQIRWLGSKYDILAMGTDVNGVTTSASYVSLNSRDGTLSFSVPISGLHSFTCKAEKSWMFCNESWGSSGGSDNYQFRIFQRY